jgi:hypothetical protein
MGTRTFAEGPDHSFLVRTLCRLSGAFMVLCVPLMAVWYAAWLVMAVVGRPHYFHEPWMDDLENRLRGPRAADS